MKSNPEGCTSGNAVPTLNCQKHASCPGCVQIISEQFAGPKQICKWEGKPQSQGICTCSEK